MTNDLHRDLSDFSIQLRWVILSRVVFAIIAIIACFVFSSGEEMSFFSQPFRSLYNIAAMILILSLIYLLWLNRFGHILGLAYFQTIVDTVLVTGIIFVTGSYDSIFTFLYLVVIIYTSMLLLQKGSIIISLISSIQYGVLIQLEYYEIITPFMGQFYLSSTVDQSHIIYRILIFSAACVAVAVLSGMLALQLKNARQDLKIAQGHLKRVEKMAAMDEMISGIAHEVKNPLASLSGSIQLLQEDTRPGSYEDKLMQIILRETERLKNIVNDIRLFAKPRIDKAEEMIVAETIEETVALFSNDPKWDKRIQLKLNLDRKACVFIDPDHLNQILWNLLKNAAQAIDGQGEIRISLRSSRNRKIYLTIQDTGKGIDSDALNHVFDPFFTTKPEGTGLGLSIIHRLIDTYKGMIDFESTPGKGTVFTVIFNDAASRSK